MNRVQKSSPVVLITGGTDGIGFAMAKQYKEAGARLLLIGRRGLVELSDPIFTSDSYCQMNLLDENVGEQVDSFCREQGIEQIDLLIHNGAIGHYGRFDEQSSDHIEEMITVNLLAPIRLSYHLLPYLKRGKGKIIFISSVVATLPCPEYPVYGATKGALEGFARNIRIELAGEVEVQVVAPGATKTKMHEKMGITRDIFDWEKFPTAEKTAALIIQEIEGRKRTAVIGFANQILRLVGKWGGEIVNRQMRGNRKVVYSLVEEQKERYCLITGAADGIGAEMAHQFAADGYTIIGIDQDKMRGERCLATLHGVGHQFIYADLRRRADLNKIMEELKEIGPFSRIVHNAGISAVGPFKRIPLVDQEQVVAVNFSAVLQLSARMVAAGLLAEGGKLLFLSSLSYYTGYPGAAVYGATKDGLASYARSLGVALGQKVQVMTLYPGPTRTAHARRYSPDNSSEKSRMSPEELVERVEAGLRLGRRKLIPGVGHKVMAAVAFCAPRFAEWGMKKLLWEKLKE